jgi:hypothetical protein
MITLKPRDKSGLFFYMLVLHINHNYAVLLGFETHPNRRLYRCPTFSMEKKYNIDTLPSTISILLCGNVGHEKHVPELPG